MKYPITVYGDTILRKRAENIEKNTQGLNEIIDNMWETMYYADGVGLAAPQAGLPIRLFVIDGTAGADEEPELKDFKKVFINPEIMELTGENWVMNEGCLSLPEIREDVLRPETIRIRYQDEEFKVYEETYSGFISRVIQHEYDHLEGVLFVDYLNPLKRRILKGKLTAISKGKVVPKYRIKVPGK